MDRPRAGAVHFLLVVLCLAIPASGSDDAPVDTGVQQSIKQFPDYDDLTHVPLRPVQGTHQETEPTPAGTSISAAQCFLLKRWSPGQPSFRGQRTVSAEGGASAATIERTEFTLEPHPLTGDPVVYSEQLVTWRRLSDRTEVIRMDFLRQSDQVRIEADGTETRSSIGMGPDDRALWVESLIRRDGTVQRTVSESPTAMSLPKEVSTGLRETYIPADHLAAILRDGERPTAATEILRRDRTGEAEAWRIKLTPTAIRTVEVGEWFDAGRTRQPGFLRSWQSDPTTGVEGEYVSFERCECPE